MQSSDQPEKIKLPFADNGNKRAIPDDSQISITPGAASFTDGFPPKTFTPLIDGGIPPDGGDFNGLFHRITAIQRWQSAGGMFKFDAAFCASVGGYPKGALLLSADSSIIWANKTESNLTDPESNAAAGWLHIPLSKLGRVEVNVEDYGAIGDGVADDILAIRACFADVKSKGGNATVNMRNRYRITDGFEIPAFTRIKGPMPSRYPFNNGSPAPALIADFDNPNQWVIEPETRNGGVRVPYNSVLTTLPDGPTYNCAVEDLLIVSVGETPYGAIRMHGCPGSIVRNVSVLDTGCGLFVNECFGGEYQIHARTLYYGAILWDEVNACKIDVYATQSGAKPRVVPVDYRFPALTSMKGGMVGTLKLSTDTHEQRPFAMVLGADAGSTSSNNELALTSEYFDGGVFMANAASAGFTRLYVEGGADEVSFGIVAAKSSFSTAATHAYLSGTGTLFDLGAAVSGDVMLDGVLSYANFGSGPFVDAVSSLTIRGVQSVGAALTVPRINVRFPGGVGTWTEPTLLNGWANAGDPTARVAYRINPQNGNTESKGYPIGGTLGTPAYVLPEGYRPFEKRHFVGISGSAIGYVIVLASGEVIPAAPTVAANGVSLDSVVFRAEH